MGCVAACGTKTICEGEAYAVANRRGEVCVVEGPATRCRCGASFDKLQRVVATEDQYLLVKFRDGRTELVRGPTSLVRHPVKHVDVILKEAIRIGDQEVIVVYRANEAGEVNRTIIRGPGMYIPKTVAEWVHEFSWTGPAESGTGLDGPMRKRVDGLKFSKLRVIPGKMYFDVESVRTKDNALISVKLMLFYHLQNVELMLDTTNDAMADFVNAVTADVIEWCSSRKFDEFLANTDALNTLAPYAQLTVQATKIGFELAKVVFRGYGAPDSLQKMHDKAIEKRTALSLAAETEEEEQKLADFKLGKESERTQRQAQLEMDRLNAEIAMKKQTSEAEQQRQRQEDALELERFSQLRKLDRNFDIGKYMMTRDNKTPLMVQCGTLQNGADASPR